MIIKGDSDYTHALEVLMNREKYNELEMLRAAYLIINRITYPKTGEKERSILPFSNRSQLMEVVGILDSFLDWIKLGETASDLKYVSDSQDKRRVL